MSEPPSLSAASVAPPHDAAALPPSGAELLRRQNERLFLLTQAAEHLLATDDPQTQVEGLYAMVADHLGVDTYFNFMVTPEGDALRLDFCAGVPGAVVPTLQRLEFGQAICGTVAQTRERIVAERIQETDYGKADLVRGFGIRAYCCHPLMAGDRLLGTLSFASHTRDSFSPDEVEFMRTICSYVAMAKERQRQAAILERSERTLREVNGRLQEAMRETHHRVKNNLQILAAMIDMQLMDGRADLPANELVRLGKHILALATIHDVLTHRDPDAAQSPAGDLVSARQVLHGLLPLLSQTAADRTFAYQVDDAFLSVKQASSLCLVMNELVANAVKHGRGEVRLRFAVADGVGCLEVCDDGPGFAPGFDAGAAAHTGLEMVRRLCAWDLAGDIAFTNRGEGGASVRVELPLDATV